MLRDYTALAPKRLQSSVGYAQRSPVVPERVTLDDPALRAMTDFQNVNAAVILPGDTVDDAEHRMIERGVRSLLVVDQERHVVGMITATDLLGEKPMQVVSQRGIRRPEVTVRDVMTPQHDLEVLDLADIRSAKVGHIVATLRRSGRQHALVAEHDANGRQAIRGLFSATQIARQLGVAIPTTEVARTFSEIEAQLAR